MANQERAGSLSQPCFLKMFLFLCVRAHVWPHTCVLECVPHLAGNGFKSVKVQGLRPLLACSEGPNILVSPQPMQTFRSTQRPWLAS